jgi:hypothetical protein
LLLVAFSVALEATCRIEDWVQFRTDILSPFTAQDQLIVRDADGVHGRPNARFQKWVMDSLGFRGPEIASRKDAGIVRIATVGASETFGLYESPGREYPRQLEDSLNATLAQWSPCGERPVARFEVLNAAMPGMSLPTVEQDIRNRSRRLQPDVVVIYATPAQYLEEALPTAARPDSSGRPLARSLPSRLSFRAASRLREQLKQLAPGPVKTWLRAREVARTLASHPAGWQFTGVPPDRLNAYEQAFRRTIGSVRSIGAVPVVVAHANVFALGPVHDSSLLGAWERFYPRATGATIIAFDSAAAQVTKQVARDSGAALVDAQAALAGGPGPVFADYAHFTDLGAGRLARAVGETVVTALRGPGEMLCRSSTVAGRRQPGHP